MILDAGHLYILLAAVFALYMTWGVGANDVANAMGTSVGSGALTIRNAVLIAAVFEFAGATLAGGHVTGTIRRGIIDTSAIATPEVLIHGMLAALLGAAVWLTVATLMGWPVSTTHSIVGALIGFGLAGAGTDAIEWGEVSGIVGSWVVSPILGGLFALLLARSVRWLILESARPIAAACRVGPLYVFLMGALISLVTMWKGLTHLDVSLTGGQSIAIALAVGLGSAVVGRALILRVPVDAGAAAGRQREAVERIFAPLCVFTACSMAFAHGANDVANGIGPLAAVISASTLGVVAQTSPLPAWALLLGGGGIVLGLATMGYRVMRTIGRRITELTPSDGFCAELAAASTVVFASRLGLPVSTTHIVVGAVLGVGIAKGLGTINRRIIVGIIASWVVTMPVAAILSIVCFYALRLAF